MLQRKNKGSILIMSLVIFSIISLICITCSSLILSNNKISDLEYKTEKLKEENLGAIELIKSNMLEEVKYALENTKTEDEFYNYLSTNNHRNFINNAKTVDKNFLENTYIEMEYDSEKSIKEFIHYKILVKSEIDNYEKYTLIKSKVENPWIGKVENTPDKTESDLEEMSSKESNEEEINNDSENVEINENDLITFYNYEEK